jgi:hypothetical protein
MNKFSIAYPDKEVKAAAVIKGVPFPSGTVYKFRISRGKEVFEAFRKIKTGIMPGFSEYYFCMCAIHEGFVP